jgi:hypothetical protein
MAHYLTRSLSPESSARAEVHTYPNPVEIGDRYLLCCDGLYNLVSEEDVARILSEHSIDEAADILVNLANERGGTDNITVELIEIERLLEEGEVSGPAPGETEVVVSTEYSTSFLSDQAKEIVRSTIVGVGQSNGAATESSDESADQPDLTSGSAVDGLLFSAANPTKDQIERHEKRFKVPGMIPEPGSEERPEPTVGAAGAPVEPTAEDVIRHEERQLRKFVVGLCVVVFFAVVGAASFLMLNRERLFPARAGEVPSSTKLAGQLATESSPSQTASESTSTPDVPTTAVEPVEPSEPAGPVGPTEQSVAVQPDTTPAPTDTHTMPPSDTVPPASMVINPAMQTVQSEKLTREAMFERLKNEILLLQPEAAAQAASELEQMKALISQASSLELPAPDASTEAETPNPDQPINWERERESRDAASEPATEVAATVPARVLVREELQAIAAQKAELRDKVADLDAKIRLAGLGTKAEAEREIALLEARAKDFDPALGFTERNYQTAQQRVKQANDRKSVADRHDKDSVLKLAEQISAANPAVQEKKSAYELASLRYTDTVEQWTENSGNAELAGTMAQRGRELRARRSNLEEAVIEAVGLELKEAQFDLAEWGVVLGDLRHQKDLLNRHIGFLKAFTPPLAKDAARASALQALLDERARLVASLAELRKQLSDAEESASRRATVLDEVGIQSR